MVQQYALRILIVLDKRDKLVDNLEAFKRSIVSGNPEFAERLFPEYFPDEEERVSSFDELSKIEGPIEFVNEGEQQITPEMMQEILNQFS